MTDDVQLKNNAPPQPEKRRLTRGERAKNTRAAIIRAAARVVGDFGYAEASIHRITDTAGIAHGTFYLYFASRQELFDQLLPTVGKDLMAFMSRAIKGAESFFDIEERGYRAFFEYMRANPWFFRVLNEAEVAAPIAHREHLAVMIDHYIASLRRSVERGEISRFDESELEALAHLLIGARSYLYLRYASSAKIPKKSQDLAVGAYMKVVRGGIS